MKRLVLLSLLLAGCSTVGGLTHVDNIARSSGHLSKSPEIFVRLSVSPQVCARRDGTVEVYITATKRWLPPGPLRFVVNDGLLERVLHADPTASLRLERVAIGGHSITVTDGEHTSRLSFSVWDCGGAQ